MRASAVGLCLSEEPLHNDVWTATPPRLREEASSMTLCAVPTDPFVANVQCDASAAALSTAFDIPEQITAEWFGSADVSSSINVPSKEIRRQNSNGELFRFTPRSVLDEYLIMSSSSYSSSPPTTQLRFSAKRTENLAQVQKACEALSSDSVRFAPLFVPADDPAADILCFALDLSQRLRSVVAVTSCTESARRCVSHTLEKNRSQSWDVCYHGNSDDFVCCKNYGIEKSPVIETKRTYCGLHVNRTHHHIEIICGGAAAQKLKGRLYRTARSVGVAAYPPDSILPFTHPFVGRTCKSRTSYFEVAIINEGDSPGGICVGVANAQLLSNRLIGSDNHSIGLHSDGFIVRGRGRFEPCKEPAAFGVGDRIGCAVSTDSSGDVVISYFLNGKPCSRFTLQAFPSFNAHSPDDHHLFAAISLFRTGSKVALLCCPHDWLIDSCILSQHFRFVQSICESPSIVEAR